MWFNVTFQRFAFCGGFVALAGAGVLSWRIRYNFKQEEHYKKSLTIFNGYQLGTKLLGPPITIKNVDLGNTDTTWSDGLNCRLAIPLSGQKKSGTLHTWSHRLKPGIDWTVDKCDLEVEGKQWTFYINPESKDYFSTTRSGQTEEFPKQWLVTAETDSNPVHNNNENEPKCKDGNTLEYVNINLDSKKK